MAINNKITRREFLETSLKVASLMGVGYLTGITSCNLSNSGQKNLIKKTSLNLNATTLDMPTRKLGNTGYNVKLFSLGGQAALEQGNNMDIAVSIINRAIDLGVNYLDSAPLYGNSELYYGEALQSRRKDIFLATKTHKRNYDSAMKSLEKSLERLKTDHLDLWQIHNVEDKYDVEDIFAKDGVLKAMIKAKDEKITKNIGITGHYDPLVLKDAITRFDFDTILMALNGADRHYKSFIENLLPTAVEKNMGIIGMKVVARGRIFNDKGVNNIKDTIDYVLTLPVSTIIIGCDNIEQLEENVRVASEFKPLDDSKMKQIEELTSPYYAEANWYKSSH